MIDSHLCPELPPPLQTHTYKVSLFHCPMAHHSQKLWCPMGTHLSWDAETYMQTQTNLKHSAQI